MGSTETAFRRVLQEADSFEDLQLGRKGDTSETDREELSEDAIFEVLCNPRRRQIIRYLDQQDGTSTISDLAESIAAVENETSVGLLSSAERKRVYIGLYQTHLPKMDQLGVVDYEKNRGTVTLRRPLADFEPYLQVDGKSSSPSASVVGALLGAAIALMVLVDSTLVGALVHDILIGLSVFVFAATVLVEEFVLVPGRRW